MRFFLCFLILILPCSLHAAVVPQQEWTTNILLQGFLFGQAPDSEMICIKGPCLDEIAPADAPKSRTIIASYKKPLDVTHLAGVEISSPRYDFHDDILIRVSFSLLCSETDSPACIKAVSSGLKESLGLVLNLSSDNELSDGQQLQLLSFSSENGTEVKIAWHKSNEHWDNPFVELSNHDLMEQVRQAANPNYQPN